jgi:hypothetical protein
MSGTLPSLPPYAGAGGGLEAPEAAACSVAQRRPYTSRPLSYIERARRPLAASRQEKPMRAEAEKLSQAIRDSLELLRRHL